MRIFFGTNGCEPLEQELLEDEYGLETFFNSISTQIDAEKEVTFKDELEEYKKTTKLKTNSCLISFNGS